MSCLRRRKTRQRNRNDGRSLPQELVDECMSYLPPTTLRASALVCRSWAMAAQPLLFNKIYVDDTRRCRRLEKTLRASSHLIRLVHELHLDREKHPLNSTALENILSFPFTHLESVTCWDVHLSTPETATALQGLLSLSTLHRVDINVSFVDPALFISIWGRCSPAIRHLKLSSPPWSPTSFHPILPHPILPLPSAPVTLASLKIERNDIDEWLNHDFCPLDFSRLAVLSIARGMWPLTTMLGRSRMAAALKSLVSLEFVTDAVVDLSQSFGPSMAFARDTLSTIAPSSPIRQIVICLPCEVDARACDQLDAQIAGLPLQHLSSVELETNMERYAHLEPFFPRLGSKNLLCRADGGWFKVRFRVVVVFHSTR
ncbi:hypothetical protein B0H14DRAFT_2930148 [Mycena olivaceomarginata]|nr:hypothetical protein B0H14DRAFT_2930148 [Mycena olivaceomarginata]